MKKGAVKSSQANAIGDRLFFRKEIHSVIRGQADNNNLIAVWLRTEKGEPLPDETITVTLPPGFTYADGGSGERDFVTIFTGTVVFYVNTALDMGHYIITARFGDIEALGKINVVEGIWIDLSTGEVAVSPSGAFVYLGGQDFPGERSELVAINTRNNVPAYLFDSNQGAVNSVVFGTRDDVVYVSNVVGVYTVDTRSHERLGQILWSDSMEVHAAISPNDEFIYATHTPYLAPDEAAVVTIRASDFTIVNEMPGFNHPRMLVCSHDGRHLYVDNSGEGTLLVVDLEVREVIRSIPMTSPIKYLGASPDGKRLYILMDSIHVLSTNDYSLSEWLNTGSTTRTAALSLDGRVLYVSQGLYPNGETPEIIAIDTEHKTTRIVFNQPAYVYNGVAAHPDGRRIYISTLGGACGLFVVLT